MARWFYIPLLLAMIALPALAQPTSTQPAPNATIIALNGEVDDYTRDSLFRKFAEARRLGATTIILDMNTPGGLVTAGLDISRFIRRQNDLHVIAFVSDKAYSAGAMIAVACNEIVMAPSAVVGDCALIVFDTSGQLSPLPPAERAKQESPIVNDFDASAARNGYDPLLLEAMVVVERVVHWVQSPTGERRFVDDKDYTTLTAQEWKPVPGVRDPLDGPNSLLTLQSDEAAKVGLARMVVGSAQELAQQRGLKVVADLSPGAGEKFVEALDGAIVRGLLLSIFMTCLYISISAPGHGAAEALTTLSLGLLIGIPLLTGYAQWWEVAAIFGGLALLAFEIFVFPGHGISAVMGIILMLSGMLMTFVGKEPSGLPGFLPSLGQTWVNVRQGLLAITAALACSFVLSMWLRKYLPHLPYFNRLILSPSRTLGATTNAQIAPENVWPGVGTRGLAVTDLKPGGSAEFVDLSFGNKRTIAVVSESGYLPAGSTLVVLQSRGNRIVVRPAND